MAACFGPGAVDLLRPAGDTNLSLTLFSVGRRPQAEGTLWGSYTFDAITNLVFGAGWFSARGVADIAAGSDLRVGRFTVRPTWRVRERMFNARITTTF